VTIKHDEALFDDVAALAVGALSDADALQLEAHLAQCTVCQAEYRAARAGFDVVLAATESGTLLPEPRADALRRNVIAAARAARPPANAGYSAVVARDALMPYAPGIQWAVVAERSVTMVYWVFTPPECGDVPFEVHDVTQAGFVLEGAMEMHYGDGTKMMCRPGDFYTIAPGTVHAAAFPERTVLLDVYAPNHTGFEAQYRESIAQPR
jgi:quercetin dioxygenase-like cupin family protein